jgi:hypothetical protein
MIENSISIWKFLKLLGDNLYAYYYKIIIFKYYFILVQLKWKEKKKNVKQTTHYSPNSPTFLDRPSLIDGSDCASTI